MQILDWTHANDWLTPASEVVTSMSNEANASQNQMLMGQTKKSTKKAQTTPKTKGAKTAAKAKAKSLASMVKQEAVALKSWDESRFGPGNGTKLGIVRVLGITTPRSGNEDGYNLILMDGSKIGTAKKHVSKFMRKSELRDSVFCTPTYDPRKLGWLEASMDGFPVGDLIDTHLDEYQVMDGDEYIDKNDRITLKLDGKMLYIYGVHIYNTYKHAKDINENVNLENRTPVNVVNGDKMVAEGVYVFNEIHGLGDTVANEVYDVVDEE